MTKLHELIDIPEQVHQADFVLKLAAGIQQAERTLRDYVVAPQLATSFDAALGFIRSAVENGQSKATYPLLTAGVEARAYDWPGAMAVVQGPVRFSNC